MKKAPQLMILLIVILISSCHKPHINAGKTITVERQIDTNYSKLSIEGSFDIHIVNDQDYDIKIISAENMLPYIKTSVSNGELIITEKSNNVYGNYKNEIYVNKSVLNRLRNDGSSNIEGLLMRLEYLDIENNGSGNIHLRCDADDHVSIDINGSGNAVVQGVSEKIFVSINGSGNIEALSLYTESAYVNISGSGNVIVNTSETLNVNISGSGNVLYLGDPSLNVSITGSGEVKPY